MTRCRVPINGWIEVDAPNDVMACAHAAVIAAEVQPGLFKKHLLDLTVFTLPGRVYAPSSAEGTPNP